ncbi:response regulator [Parendozoicomonas haliclonae]|uniref:Transcriptional regulatory protein OmpR n=1 Tax=Parendozoicomonas haliclonae TaxID=1960125 RepID=A0A1X7AJ36_9GAMM|nr:response regulator [Parendozoicomonas haliclonae]SMA44379.1 Transcriptional regulatory protein OmpR [Parendozoicomonas haliclonae]
MAQSEHILVVDDYYDIRDVLSEYLGKHGMRVTTAENGAEMREALENHDDIDLIVLDQMLPGEDGLTLCRYVRSVGGPPIIILSAMDEEADRVAGLEVGADDYLCKPFSTRELLARIRAVLRRGHHEALNQMSSHNDRVRFGSWILDNNLRQLEDESELVTPLSTAEYRLLSAFTSHPREVLSREQLLAFTQDGEVLPFDRSIDNQVSRLRRKLEKDTKNPSLIKTVRGGGYMLTAEIMPV